MITLLLFFVVIYFVVRFITIEFTTSNVSPFSKRYPQRGDSAEKGIWWIMHTTDSERNSFLNCFFLKPNFRKLVLNEKFLEKLNSESYTSFSFFEVMHEEEHIDLSQNEKFQKLIIDVDSDGKVKYPRIVYAFAYDDTYCFLPEIVKEIVINPRYIKVFEQIKYTQQFKNLCKY